MSKIHASHQFSGRPETYQECLNCRLPRYLCEGTGACKRQLTYICALHLSPDTHGQCVQSFPSLRSASDHYRETH